MQPLSLRTPVTAQLLDKKGAIIAETSTTLEEAIQNGIIFPPIAHTPSVISWSYCYARPSKTNKVDS